MSVFKYQLLDKLLNVFKPVILPENNEDNNKISLSLRELFWVLHKINGT